MNNKMITGLLALLMVGVVSCKDKVNLPDQPLENYVQVYLPQAANGPVTYNFSTGDAEAPTIIYGANYGGYGYPEQDVELSFSVDASVADSFNTANNSSYVLLPPESYSLSDTKAVIKKGELTTAPFKATVYTTGENAPADISKTYILPVTLHSNSLKVNATLQTYFCLINIIPEFFDRSNWTVADFSSEEATGEGANNGRAEFALDGNNNTFWHSQWKNGRPGPPHYFTIDLGASKRILGSAVVDRQNVTSGRPESVQYFVSENGTDWTLAFSGDLQDTGDLQNIFFPEAVQGRYVKFQINTIYGSDVTNLAEFYLF